MVKVPLVPQPDKFNVLIIIDSYGWAWDIASRQMLAHLPDGYAGQVINYWDLFNKYRVNPADWDVCLVYTYRNDMVMAAMDPRNTVIMVESDPSTVMSYLKPLYDRFSHLAGMNGKVAYHLMNMYMEGHQQREPPRIHYLRHGVDTDQFHPPPSPPDRFTVGWVGRADRPSKRFTLADDAMMRVDADWKPLKGLKDAGYVPPAAMPNYYRGLDALLVTSIVEVHPLVVYEAMSSGVVPLTPRVGDVEEYLNRSNSVLLPYELTPRTVADYVERLRDSGSRGKMRRAARHTAVKSLSWGVLISSWINMFSEVAYGE